MTVTVLNAKRPGPRVTAAPELATLAEQIRPVALAREQMLPVIEPLCELFPAGALRRGSNVSITGVAATTLAMALSAEASRMGSWTATVGLSGLGLRSCRDLGMDLGRLAVIDRPPPGTWATAVAGLVEAFDLVVVGEPARLRPADARRLTARLRDRGSVLLRVGWPRNKWPDRADCDLETTSSSWTGIGQGCGHLEARRIEVNASTRRGDGRSRRARLWLPNARGSVTRVDAEIGVRSPDVTTRQVPMRLVDDLDRTA